MSGYIVTIITLSVISGITGTLIGTENEAIKKRFNFVIGLIFAIILLSPIVILANNSEIFKSNINNMVDNLDFDHHTSNQLIVNESSEKICQGIKSSVISRFNINDSEIRVSLVLDDQNIESIIIKQVVITLSGKATWEDEFKIQEFVETQTGCKVKIIKR